MHNQYINNECTMCINALINVLRKLMYMFFTKEKTKKIVFFLSCMILASDQEKFEKISGDHLRR